MKRFPAGPVKPMSSAVSPSFSIVRKALAFFEPAIVMVAFCPAAV
jgi:hypothetical protein